MGVPRSELSFSLRVYADLKRDEVVNYWIKQLNITRAHISSVETIYGKEKGKLKFGMCRVRIKKGAKYFKFIMSIINRIKEVV